MEHVPFDLQERVTPRVLLFSVDDALLALHLGWVEAVLPGHAAEVFTVPSASGVQPFVVYRDEPAFLLEPRALFGLTAPREASAQRALLVLRSGSHLLALRVDECVGVQEVDLQRYAPVASALCGDGGAPVGHLVELDGRAVAVLDPSRLLDGAAREELTRAAREARAFLEREGQSAELWREIAASPNLAILRKYARLCRQNGWARRSRAARAVLKAGAAPKAFDDAVDGAATNGGPHPPVAETLLGILLRLESAEQSAGIAVEDGTGSWAGVVVVRDGRVIDASSEREQGLPALAELLALRDARAHRGEPPREARLERIATSTTASLIDALARGGERRARS